MNNSFITKEVSLSLDEKVDTTEQLGIEESRLVRIIEAIGRINVSEDWSTLKSLIFDSRIEQLKKQLTSECEKRELDTAEIYRLQGKLYEAKKYDLDNLVKTRRIELLKIRKLTQPTER